MTKCAYCSKTCKINERTAHSFPFSDPERLAKWVKNMGLGKDWKPSRNMRLCSDHFQPYCYTPESRDTSKKLLKKDAVPTVFPDLSRKCVACKIATTRYRHGRSFHRFPINCPNLSEKWLHNLNIIIPNFKPTKDSVICSDHFERNCYTIGRGRFELRFDAVPTIFPTRTPDPDITDDIEPPCIQINDFNELDIKLEPELIIDFEEDMNSIAPDIPNDQNTIPQIKFLNPLPANLREIRAGLANDHQYEKSVKSLKQELTYYKTLYKTAAKKAKLANQRARRQRLRAERYLHVILSLTKTG